MMQDLLLVLSVLEWSHWVLIASVAILLINLSVFYRYSNKLRQEHNELKKLQKDLRALITASVGMGQRMLEVERRHRRLAERQDQLDIYDSANQSYEQAIKMTQNGSGIQDLMDICGMSKTEAELIQMIHGLDKTA